MQNVLFDGERVKMEYDPLMEKYKVFIGGKHIYNFDREDLIAIAEIVFGSEFKNKEK